MSQAKNQHKESLLNGQNAGFARFFTFTASLGFLGMSTSLIQGGIQGNLELGDLGSFALGCGLVLAASLAGLAVLSNIHKKENQCQDVNSGTSQLTDDYSHSLNA